MVILFPRNYDGHTTSGARAPPGGGLQKGGIRNEAASEFGSVPGIAPWPERPKEREWRAARRLWRTAYVRRRHRLGLTIKTPVPGNAPE